MFKFLDHAKTSHYNHPNLCGYYHDHHDDNPFISQIKS